MKPTAILCDIDGTLAHMKDRGPFDWARVGEDDVDLVVADLIKLYPHVILMSGRKSICRPETEKWLEDYGILYDLLFMRQEDDDRQDGIVKWELYEEHIRPNYNIEFVLDDRNHVVKMWREHGLKCLQVEEGDF